MRFVYVYRLAKLTLLRYDALPTPSSSPLTWRFSLFSLRRPHPWAVSDARSLAFRNGASGLLRFCVRRGRNRMRANTNDRRLHIRMCFFLFEQTASNFCLVLDLSSRPRPACHGHVRKANSQYVEERHGQARRVSIRRSVPHLVQHFNLARWWIDLLRLQAVDQCSVWTRRCGHYPLLRAHVMSSL